MTAKLIQTTSVLILVLMDNHNTEEPVEPEKDYIES